MIDVVSKEKVCELSYLTVFTLGIFFGNLYLLSFKYAYQSLPELKPYFPLLLVISTSFRAATIPRSGSYSGFLAIYLRVFLCTPSAPELIPGTGPRRHSRAALAVGRKEKAAFHKGEEGLPRR